MKVCKILAKLKCRHLLAGIRLHLGEIEADPFIQTVGVMCGRTALHRVVALPWWCHINRTTCTQPGGGALKLLCNRKQSMKMGSLCHIMLYHALFDKCQRIMTQAQHTTRQNLKGQFVQKWKFFPRLFTLMSLQTYMSFLFRTQKKLKNNGEQIPVTSIAWTQNRKDIS